jgi:hypothetical protein
MDETSSVTDLSDGVERAYRAQAEQLWRALVLFCGDREVASDAVSEAFAQAISRGTAVDHADSKGHGGTADEEIEGSDLWKSLGLPQSSWMLATDDEPPEFSPSVPSWRNSAGMSAMANTTEA